MEEVTGTCVSKVLVALVSLVAALQACEVLDPFTQELLDDLVAFREELEEMTD